MLSKSRRGEGEYILVLCQQTLSQVILANNWRSFFLRMKMISTNEHSDSVSEYRWERTDQQADEGGWNCSPPETSFARTGTPHRQWQQPLPTPRSLYRRWRPWNGLLCESNLVAMEHRRVLGYQPNWCTHHVLQWCISPLGLAQPDDCCQGSCKIKRKHFINDNEYRTSTYNIHMMMVQYIRKYMRERERALTDVAFVRCQG